MEKEARAKDAKAKERDAEVKEKGISHLPSKTSRETIDQGKWAGPSDSLAEDC